MAKDSRVIVTTIQNTSKMVATGTEQGILALSIEGSSQAKVLANFSQGYQTGRTRNSIQFQTGAGRSGGFNDGDGENAGRRLEIGIRPFEAVVGATTDYATYVEFGTRNMAPQPFLRPSLALLAGQTPKIVAAKMTYEFNKGALKYGQKRVTF